MSIHASETLANATLAFTVTDPAPWTVSVFCGSSVYPDEISIWTVNKDYDLGKG